MSDGRSSLVERRDRLIALAAAQRRRLAADVEPWRRPLSIVDRALAAVRFIGHHPAWVVGSAVAPVALRATSLGTWFRRGLTAWQIVRELDEARAKRGSSRTLRSALARVLSRKSAVPGRVEAPGGHGAEEPAH